MFRSAAAVLGSYVFLSVALFVLYAVAMFDVPHNVDPDTLTPTPLFIVVSLVWGFLSAAAAGYLVGKVAGRRPLEHALALAVFTGLLGVVSLAVNLGDRSVGYELANLVLLLAGATAGGWLRSQRVPDAAKRADGPSPEPAHA